jgi:hypothetical protein
MVYEDRQVGLAFTGDHILPRITPSIALERMPEELPLRSYLDSLRLFLDLPDAWMLPAHGAVTQSVKARVDELLDHHRERLELVHGLVAAGSYTAYDVARRMLWTRRERTVDELGAVHGMTAILDVGGSGAEPGGVARVADPAEGHVRVVAQCLDVDVGGAGGNARSAADRGRRREVQIQGARYTAQQQKTFKQ